MTPPDGHLFTRRELSALLDAAIGIGVHVIDRIRQDGIGRTEQTHETADAKAAGDRNADTQQQRSIKSRRSIYIGCLFIFFAEFAREQTPAAHTKRKAHGLKNGHERKYNADRAARARTEL